MKIRKGSERGRTVIDWLDSYHSFSFGDYHDAKFMGFRHLRVINEDFVKAGKGFHPHSHQDMEIITYILEGSLEHKDSLGNGAVIRPGEIQRMSAGTGITHSEFNPSHSEAVHLLQIWIFPSKKGIQPGYQQIKFDPEKLHGHWYLLASPEKHAAAVTIHQNARLYASRLQGQEKLEVVTKPGRYAWVQVARGQAFFNEHLLAAGDGAAFNPEEHAAIVNDQCETELLLFDLD